MNPQIPELENLTRAGIPKWGVIVAFISTSFFSVEPQRSNQPADACTYWEGLPAISPRSESLRHRENVRLPGRHIQVESAFL